MRVCYSNGKKMCMHACTEIRRERVSETYFNICKTVKKRMFIENHRMILFSVGNASVTPILFFFNSMKSVAYALRICPELSCRLDNSFLLKCTHNEHIVFLSVAREYSSEQPLETLVNCVTLL